ncbi:DUF1499 domain-containing protein [Aurantimonas marianensis]|uniref:DUF1499 domain-containing protein n=1 Tax=Aurantimonas marianensis TaxID=2920428 RepID=A0A9X2KFB2_9HYPH|nr:DUF1499 domain-containing protein [Aurantimonas marianensis]MCP3056258.1 DUF1499 domain-containing protein [Aurantimonas marianensis]
MSSIYGRLPVSGHYLRKRLRLAGFARKLAAFALILLMTTLVIYRLGAILPQALIGLLLLTAAAAALALLISLYGLLRAWFQGVAGGGAALGAFVLASIGLSPFAYTAYLAAVNPRTNAAYTDGMDPDGAAMVTVVQTPADAPVTVAPETALAEPSVVPGRRFVAAAPRVYAAARIVLDDLGWQVGGVVAEGPAAAVAATPGLAGGDLGVSGAGDIPIPTARAEIDAAAASDPLDRPDSERYRISAVARDLLFALPSDISIRIIQDGDESFVDLQSVSRSIDIDFGQNRRFIERFLENMDTAMAGLETVETGN